MGSLAALPLALLALGLLSGCGLPSNLPGLAAPTGALVNAIPGTLFSFTNTPPDPSYTLLGFELYYKLYDDTSSQLLGAYISDTSQFTAANYATPGVAVLVAEGYQRLVGFLPSVGYTVSTYSNPTYLSASQASALQQLPMIPVSIGDRATAFTVQISFQGYLSSPLDNWVPTITANGGGITFANGGTVLDAGRLLTESFSGSPQPYLKGFSPKSFSNLDPDMPPSLTALSVNSTIANLGVGLVALAYGFDPNILTVYSIPVPIGYYLLTNLTLEAN